MFVAVALLRFTNELQGFVTQLCLLILWFAQGAILERMNNLHNAKADQNNVIDLATNVHNFVLIIMICALLFVCLCWLGSVVVVDNRS